MAVTEEFLVAIDVDSSGAVKGMRVADKSLQNFQKTSKKTEKSTESLGSVFGKFGAKLIVLNQALQLGQSAFRALAGPVAEVTKAYATQEAAETKLASALKLTGNFTKENLNDFKQFASELQNVSTVGDETSLRFASIATSMGLTKDQTKELITASAELSSATGKDLDASFQTLLKTFGGFAGELGEALPDVKGLTQAQLQAGDAVKLVAETFKGAAAGDIRTFSGQMKQLSNDFGDLQEQIGQTIVEVFRVPSGANALRMIIKDITAAVEELRPVLVEVGSQVIAVFDAIQQATAGIDFAKLAAEGEKLAAVLGLIAAPFVIKAFIAMAAPLAVVAVKFVAIAAAIGAVIAVIELVIKNFDKLDKVAALVGDTIILVFGNATKFMAQAFNTAIKGILGVTQKFVGLFSESMAKSMDGAVAAVDKRLDELEKEGAEFNRVMVSQVKESASELDTGFIGAIFSEGQKFIDSFNSSLEVTSEQSKQATKDLKQTAAAMQKAGAGGGTGGSAPVISQADMKAVIALQQQNRDIERQIQAIGASRVTQIQLQLQGELDKLQVRREEVGLQMQSLNNQLKEVGIGKQKEESLKNQLAGQQKILDELDKQEDLIKQRANRTIKQEFEVQIVSPDQIDQISNAFGGQTAEMVSGIAESFAGPVSALQGMGSLVSGLAAGPLAMIGAANMIADAIQGLIDAIPQLLSKIANIFNSLTELPLAIAQGVADVIDSVINFITNFIPNLVKGLGDIIESLIVGLMIEIPNAIAGLIEELPAIVEGFVERLPEFVELIVVGMITRTPKFIAAWIKFLVKGMPKLAITLVKVMIQELPQAIVDGIVEALKQIGDLFSFDNLFGGGGSPQLIDEKSISKGLRRLEDNFTGVTDSVFKVIDLSAEARASDKADEMANNIRRAGRQAGIDLWKAFVDAVKRAGQWFIDRGLEIWRGLVDGFLAIATWFGDRGTEIWNGFIKPVLQWFQDRGKEIWDGLKQAFGGAATWFGDRGTEIWNGFILPVANWFGDRGTEIWNGFILPVANWFGDRGTEIWNGFIMPIANWFGDRGTEIWNGFLNPVFSWFGDRGTEIWDGLTGAFDFDEMKKLGSRIVTGFWSKIINTWDDLGKMGSKMASGFWNWIVDIWDNIGKIGSQIGSGFWNWLVDIWDEFGKIGRNIAVNLWNKLTDFDFGGLFGGLGGGGGGGGGGGVVGKITGALGLAGGGLVPGGSFPVSPGFLASAQRFATGGSVDTVPAMLSPGEFVMSRPAVNAFGANLLGQMNQGRANMGGTTVNQNISLKVETGNAMPDESFIRQRLLPTVKNELRRASREGEIVMFDTGIRSK